MTVMTSLTSLVVHLKKVREEFAGLRTMVVEDKPIKDDVALTGIMGDALDDLVGWMDEALTALSEMVDRLVYPLNPGLIQQILVQAISLFDQVLRRFFSELAAFKPQIELLRLGKQHGYEWLTWARAVRKRLELCYQPIFDANLAFSACWQELNEYGGGISFKSFHITHMSPPPEDKNMSKGQE